MCNEIGYVPNHAVIQNFSQQGFAARAVQGSERVICTYLFDSARASSDVDPPHLGRGHMYLQKVQI